MRQGKYFEITIAPETDHQHAQQQIEEIAREILANPVIEDFRVELLD